MVVEVPKAGANLSATVPNKARATSNPAINPTIDAICFTKPFINPIMTPMPVTASMIISIVVISIILIKSSNVILNIAKNLPAHALGEVPDPSLCSG